MIRRLDVLGVVVVAALTSPGAPHAQTPVTNARVWTGTWEEHDTWAGSGRVGRSQAQITYHYVQAPDEFGGLRWASRRLTWSAVWEEDRFDYVALWEHPPDERGFTMRRHREDSVTLCTSRGTLELGPAVAGSGDDLTPAQKAQLLAGCVTAYQPREGGVPTPPPTTTETRELLQVLGMPNEDELTGCTYEKTWPKGGRPAGSFSVSVSAPVTAVMAVDPTGEYGRFVPEPGRRLTFTASVPTGTARFRFQLDSEATSRFPGYATNAPVDDVFFVKHNLGHWRGRYANDGPDLIFDAEHFGRQEWSRIDPLVVETRTAQSGVVFSVTAMDYAAIGTLRAFVRSEDCGDWLPLPVRVGTETREAVTIPMDEDHNLMADALEEYRGLDPGVDADAEPKGNGMAGDGLTAFEEYRGFLMRGVGCGAEDTRGWYSQVRLTNESQVRGVSDIHARTSAGDKDLFIHTPDAELALAAPAFADATGLTVHLICEQHYVDNDSRVVNFTLHQSGLRRWQGRTIALEEPQHGLRLEPAQPFGLRGLSIPVAEGYLGPPKLTLTVQVTKPTFDSHCIGCLLEYADLIHTAVHELGHSIGIPHHGDTVENFRSVPGRQNITTRLSLQQHAGGPPDFAQPDSLPDDPSNYFAAVNGRNYLTTLLVEPGGGCVEGAADAVYYKEGRFAGCSASSIARRGQQNSGDFECPMRYSGSHYYEAPGTVAQFRWTDRVARNTFGRLQNGYLVDAWGGRLLKYRNDLDRDGAGRLCSRISGTGINSLPGDENHNGDAGREKACADYIVVNDLAARGIR